MRKIIFIFFVSVVHFATLAGTSPIALEYCTTDYNGVVSNGSSVLCYGTHGVITRSTDKGETWTRVSLGAEHDILRMDTIGTSYMALSQTALFISENNGETWKTIPLREGIDLCHKGDAIFVLTQYGILSCEVSKIPAFQIVVELDSTTQYRKLIATSSGNLHWIEEERYVSNYALKTNQRTRSDIIALYPCPVCNKIDGLSEFGGKLFVYIKWKDYSSDPNDNMRLFTSADNGATWNQYLPVNIPDPQNISNFSAVDNGSFVALRRKSTTRRIDLPSTDTNKVTIPLPFLLFEYITLHRDGKVEVINKGDTILERYALYVSDQQIHQFIKLSDDIIIGVGNNHTIVKSTNNGSTWSLQSYFPHDENYFIRWSRSTNSSTIFMPAGNGVVYKTNNAGVTITPQRFRLYSQNVMSKVVFSHFKANGEGCVVYATVKEKDSNVFVTRDYGESYLPVESIPNFNIFEQDSIGRNFYKMVNIDVTQTVETKDAFLISGTPTYLNSNFIAEQFPYSTIVRLDKNYRFLDTVVIPVSRILAMNVVGNTVYLMGMHLKDWSLKQSPQEIEYPVYSLYKSTNSGKTWDSINVSIPLPNEYSKNGQSYRVKLSFLSPSFLFDRFFVYGAGINRMLVFSIDKEIFDTLSLPFHHIGGFGRNKVNQVANNIFTATLQNSLVYTSTLSGVQTKWDSVQLGDLVPWANSTQFFGFVPNHTDTGFACIGEFKSGGIVDIYKTHLLQYKPNKSATTIEIDEAKTYLWNTAPFPQPTRGILSTVVVWDLGYTLQDVGFSMYDVMGNKITNASISATPLQQYSATVTVDCSSLAKGVYVIHIQLKGSTRIVPIVVY